MLKNDVIALGVMSGSSLDGLDMALCRFCFQKSKWSYELLKHKTISYHGLWKKRLSECHLLTGSELMKTDADYAHYIASEINLFLKRYRLKPDVIGSHGHTVFHQPERSFTFQLGSGAVIASLTGVDVVSNFRQADLALGGQGAPLVPVGDEFLFGQYDACLNLGGIANISFRKNKKRLAYDICPVNMILNNLSLLLRRPFDKDGILASAGQVHHVLLKKLNCLSYYRRPCPKSLGREWFETVFYPLIQKERINVYDKLATCTEHAAIQIAEAIEKFRRQPCTVLVTGGGAHNKFLIERIRHHAAAEMVLPDESLIDMKEAIVFALLAVLRINNLVNCFKSATGARSNSISGALYKTP